MPKRKHVKKKKKKREIVFISLGKIFQFLRVVENGATWGKLEPKTKRKKKERKSKFKI